MLSRVSQKVYWYGPEHHTILPCKCSTSRCEGLGILWAKAKTGRKFQTQLRSLLTFSQDRCTKALEVVSVPWQNVEIDCDHLNNTKASRQYYSLCSMKRPRVLSCLPLHLPSRDEMIDHPRTHPKNFVRFAQQFTGTHFYSRVERSAVGGENTIQVHNTTWTLETEFELDGLRFLRQTC